MNRRSFLRGGSAIVGGASLSGCLSRLGFGEDESRTPPVVEDPPDAVYVPSHVEGMKMGGTTDAAPYTCALSFSFPHRFWLVTGQNRERVEVRDDDSVHLMVSLWDAETTVVSPTSDITIEISQDGETVVEKPPWPMLSQNMGFHFGDNVALPGDGTYSVNVGIGPLQTRRTGAFTGMFEDPASGTFSFEYSKQQLEDSMITLLEDRQGQRGAVDPMNMEMIQIGQLPPANQLPGQIVGERTSGDGKFVTAVLDQPPNGIDESGAYLAVSARTPHNRYPLPFMSLSGTVSRDGSSIFEGPFQPTLDPELDYHYGHVIDEIQSGDSIELRVGAPPQISRHEGYETAFFEMNSMQFTVP